MNTTAAANTASPAAAFAQPTELLRVPSALSDGRPSSTNPESPNYRWNPYSMTASFTADGSSSDDSTGSRSDSPVIASAGSSNTPKSDSGAAVSAADERADEAMVTIIAKLRDARTDALVHSRVFALSRPEIAAIENCLARRPALVASLCTCSRGVVVSDVIEALGAGSHNLFATVAAQLPVLSRDQGGCIALTRVYEAASAEQRQQIDQYVAANAAELAAHPYGNYLVRRAIQTGDATAMASISAHLCDPETMGDLAGAKSASPIVETFIKTTSAANVLPVARAVVETSNLLTWMAGHAFANFVLQALLRRLFAIGGTEADKVQSIAAQTVPSATAGSPYHTKICGTISFSARPPAYSRPAPAQQQQQALRTQSPLSTSSSRCCRRRRL